MPRPDNAIYQLAEGLVRFEHFKFPVQLNDVTRAFFSGTAAIETPENAAAMRALLKNPDDAAAAATLSKDPRYNSILRTTCVATLPERRPRGQRAPANRDRARQLPRLPERADRLGARDDHSRARRHRHRGVTVRENAIRRRRRR